jgi:hypothetical protein
VPTLSALHAPDALAHEHLLSHPVPSLGIPSSVPGCHDPLPCRPPRLHTIHRPEAPSAGRSLRLCSSLTLGARLPGRHWYPDFAATGPASDMLSRPASPNARPKSVPAFTGAPEPHAAYRLLQRSIPRTHLRSAQTLPLVAAANRCAPGGDAPCGAPPTELLQARGLSGLSALSTPTTTTARRSGFTPT